MAALAGDAAVATVEAALVRRLPGAVWRQLPVMVALAAASATVAWLATWAWGVSAPALLVAGVLTLGPTAAIVSQRLHAETGNGPVRWWPTRRAVMRAVAVTSIPVVTASAALLNVEWWGYTGSPLALGLAVIAVVTTLVTALVAVIAGPTVTLRGDVRMRTAWKVSAFAASKSPSTAVGTLLTAAALAVLLVSFTGLAVALVLPFTAALGYLAADIALTKVGAHLEYRAEPTSELD